MNTSDFTENRFLKLIDNIDQRGTSLSGGVPFSPFRPFKDLSMKERAAVIRIGVLNGLRDLESIRSKYNEYADGGHIYDGESEETQQLEIADSYPMSQEDYITLRILETRDSAYNVMHNRVSSVPVVINGVETGPTCLMTYTDSFGRRRAIGGNRYWIAKGKSGKPIYQEKGFLKLSPTDRLIPSDMVQFVDAGVPYHASMFDSYKTDEPSTDGAVPIKATYSNGDLGTGAMRKNASIWYRPGIDNAYRFVGNAADSARWINEYNALIDNNKIADNNEFASGGSIHIKPENRGKFTALKKRTGHSASWFKAHGTPAQRKMATFALNARKWKHGDGGYLFDEGGDTEVNEEYYPIWLDGVTVKPSGNRPTTRDDWNWANWRELQNEREQQAAESVRRGIDRNGTPIAAGIYGLAAAPFAIEGLGSSAVANGVRTGLQTMNTAFTPSTWLNPVTGAKLLSPTVGTIADAGIQGAFAYEGLNGLWNQGKQGTLLSNPASTLMHGLEVLPLAGPLGYAAKSTVGNRVKPFMDFLWNDGNVIQRKMPYNPNNFYREVSKEAIDDAANSGVVRTNGRFLGPYFAKGNSPLGTEDYIIEGYPNKNSWVHPDYYKRTVNGDELPNGRNLFIEEDAPFSTYVFPYYEGTVNSTPTSNFTYWQRHPIIGWRQHSFDNVTKAKHTYNAPKADIMPVEGSITTSDIPNITPENAASITPEQWTAAQNAAIARGDIVEAQRLRNMHFAMKAPNTTVSAPVYHGSDETFNVFDINKFGKNDAGSMGKGFYFTPDERFAANYGPTRSFYLNVENPIPETEQLNAFILGSRNKQEVFDRMDAMVQNGLADKAQIEALKPMVTDDLVTKVNMHDGVMPMDFQGRYAEIVAKNPSQIKSASAITYDDAGNVIPLSKRDDFNNPDIRYSLLPWILGGGAGIAGYGYLNQNEGPLVGMAMGGRLSHKNKKNKRS